MKILVLSCGGTISQMPNEDGVLGFNDGCYKGGTFARLLKPTSEVLGIELVHSKTILSKDSSNFVIDDWKKIIKNVVTYYDEYDAFIVLHGTDTMAYSTSAASFALGNLGKPVVFTGSQIPYGQPGTDAVKNLENCLRVIMAHPELVGVYMVFGTQIVSGVRVKKKTEFDYDAFKSSRRARGLGVVGTDISLNNSEVKIHLDALRPFAKVADDLDVRNDFSDKVMALSEFPGMRSDLMIALAEAGTKGFLVRSFGDGNINITENDAPYESLRPALEYMKEKGIPVVITSQAPHGSASMQLYGPAILAKELGAIAGFDMGIESAIVKLSWLIAQETPYKKIEGLMQKSLRGEINKGA